MHSLKVSALMLLVMSSGLALAAEPVAKKKMGAAKPAVAPAAKAPKVKAPYVEPAFFASTSLMEVTIKGPINTLFGRFLSLPPIAGKQSNDSDIAFEPGTIEYRDPQQGMISIPMKMRVRGNTSKKDCPFPKLVVQFDKAADLSKTIFANMKSLKIATHCADIDGNSGGYSRLRNQLSPNREALAYRILETLGVQTMKTRPGRITYVYTDQNYNHVVRNGMYIETDGQFENRVRAEEIFPTDSLQRYNANMERQREGLVPLPGFNDAMEKAIEIDVAMAYLGNGMLVNKDWDLAILGQSKNGHGLWNFKALIGDNGVQMIVPFDFDLAGLVIWPDRADARYLKTTVENLKQRPDLIQAVKSRFSAKKNAVRALIKGWDFSYRDIQSGEIKEDKAGRQDIQSFIDRVFKTLESL